MRVGELVGTWTRGCDHQAADRVVGLTHEAAGFGLAECAHLVDGRVVLDVPALAVLAATLVPPVDRVTDRSGELHRHLTGWVTHELDCYGATLPHVPLRPLGGHVVVPAASHDGAEDGNGNKSSNDADKGDFLTLADGAI